MGGELSGKIRSLIVMGVPNESMAIKARVYATLVTHNSVFAQIELSAENSKLGKRIRIPFKPYLASPFKLES